VLVLTGYGVEARKAFKRCTFQPEHTAEDLLEAVQWILTYAGSQS
jgi:hypothetical protein